MPTVTTATGNGRRRICLVVVVSRLMGGWTFCECLFLDVHLLYTYLDGVDG